MNPGGISILLEPCQQEYAPELLTALLQNLKTHTSEPSRVEVLLNYQGALPTSLPFRVQRMVTQARYGELYRHTDPFHHLILMANETLRVNFYGWDQQVLTAARNTETYSILHQWLPLFGRSLSETLQIDSTPILSRKVADLWDWDFEASEAFTYSVECFLYRDHSLKLARHIGREVPTIPIFIGRPSLSPSTNPQLAFKAQQIARAISEKMPYLSRLRSLIPRLPTGSPPPNIAYKPETVSLIRENYREHNIYFTEGVYYTCPTKNGPFNTQSYHQGLYPHPISVSLSLRNAQLMARKFPTAIHD